jgi:hypothetical protein
MAVDGTVLDVPDSAANARVFGYPGSRKVTRAAFPKVRLVLLIEAGTHLDELKTHLNGSFTPIRSLKSREFKKSTVGFSAIMQFAL